MVSNSINKTILLLGEAVLYRSYLLGRHNHKINNFVKNTQFIVRHNAKNNIYVFEKQTQF